MSLRPIQAVRRALGAMVRGPYVALVGTATIFVAVFATGLLAAALGGAERLLEAWAGEPFLLATGDPWKAQALFSFAHGMVILELDDRFPEGSELDRSWDAGAAAFAG